MAVKTASTKTKKPAQASVKVNQDKIAGFIRQQQDLQKQFQDLQRKLARPQQKVEIGDKALLAIVFSVAMALVTIMFGYIKSDIDGIKQNINRLDAKIDQLDNKMDDAYKELRKEMNARFDKLYALLLKR